MAAKHHPLPGASPVLPLQPEHPGSSQRARAFLVGSFGLQVGEVRQKAGWLCFKAKPRPQLFSAGFLHPPLGCCEPHRVLPEMSRLGGVSPTAWRRLTCFCPFSQAPVSPCHLPVPPREPAWGPRWPCRAGGLLQCRGEAPEQETGIKPSTYQGRDRCGFVALWPL